MESDNGNETTVQATAMKVALCFGSAIVIGSALWFGSTKNTEAMAIASFVGLSILFFAFIENSAKFKASKDGIKAETRKVVTKAKDTLAELQELATIMGAIQVSLLVHQGRMGGYPEYEQERYRSEILRILKRIGIPEKKRFEVLEEVRRFTKYDYVLKILGGSAMPKGINPEKIGEWKSLRRQLDNPPSPTDLTRFLEEAGITNEESKELINDYEY